MVGIGRRLLFAGGGTLIASGLLGKWGGTARADALLSLAQTEVTQPVKPAPDVGFLRADGSEVKLSAYLGKPIVLNFWATWCAPCVAELPSLDQLAVTLANDHIQVLAVSEDLGAKAADVVQNYYSKHGITRLPVLIDHYGKASDGFDNQGVPTTLLIDKTGEIRARFEGGTNWSEPTAIDKIRQIIG